MHSQAWSKKIKGVDDFELSIARKSPLVYHCAMPVSGKAAGLVFLIPDFNDLADGEDFARLRQMLADAYDLLVVTVEYHCYRSRLKDGARMDIGQDAMTLLKRICGQHGIALIDNNALISALMQLPQPFEFEVRMIPPNGDYQNVGLMSAFDHLLVLQDILKSGQVLFDEANVIAMGRGYGGYLAHLMAKLAPNTLRAVFDYSSIVEPPLGYIFSGRPHGEAAYYYEVGKARLSPLIATQWSQDRNSPHFFSQARRIIRNVAMDSQVQSMRLNAERGCQYRIVSEVQLDASLAQNKRQQSKLLADAGFDVVLQEKVNAGLGDAGEPLAEWTVLKQMFEEFYPALPTKPGLTDFQLQSSVAYLCDDYIYGFEYGDWGCLPNIIRLENRQKSKYFFY